MESIDTVDLKAFDLNLLVGLDALIIEGSGAARRIGIVQPAMSHALSRLRDQFGDPLPVRVGSTMRPTAGALDLAEPVARVLADIRANVLCDRVFLPEGAHRSPVSFLPIPLTGFDDPHPRGK